MEIIVLEDLGTQFMPHSVANRRYHKWKVKCPICGKEWFRFGQLNLKTCKECGNKEASKERTTHGMHRHRLMQIYSSMKQRCYNQNHRQYRDYGGKGVVICDEWLKDKTKFFEWSLSNGYRKDFQLDKDYLCQKLNINPKIYSPQTCRWVSIQDNAAFTSRRKLSEEDYLAIHLKYAKGISRASLAKEYKCSWNNIKAILLNFRLENNELKRI